MIECTQTELHHMLARRVETLRKIAENRRGIRDDRIQRTKDHVNYCALVLEEIAKTAD